MGIVDDFKGSGGFTRIGEGSFPCRIVQVIDLGTQEDEYKGDIKQIRKLWITFELPTETIKIDGEEKPRWLSSEFTRSTNEKARLMKVLLAAFTSEELENVESFKELLNRQMLVTIGTTSGGKDKFTGAAAMPKGMAVADLANQDRYFDIEAPDREVFDGLPDFLKDKIELAPEFIEAINNLNDKPSVDGKPVDDDLPF